MSRIETAFFIGIWCGAAIMWLIFIVLHSARTRRGRVRSKPLLGGATPPGKGAGLKGKPAVGRRKESEVCPRCKGTGSLQSHEHAWKYMCYLCNGTGERIAPPKRPLHRHHEEGRNT